MRSPATALLAVLALTAAAAGLAACGGVVEREPNLIAGKRAFVAKCGSCHVLARAGTQGNQGPNLDEAFRQSLADGIKRSTIEGVVHKQTLQPNRTKQVDPVTNEPTLAMPADLVQGDLSLDVAAYVASVVAKSGDDTGRLADIGSAEAKGTAKAMDGEVEIPANPDGQLAYQVADATAPPGQLDIKSVNKSGTPHDIAIEGNGVSDKGEVVKDGGTSEVKVDLKPGNYTFFCTVPGHREAGMEGKLTVKKQ